MHRKFSFTRLNLHVAVLAAERSGCVIVDSTRRGKQYPDSFNATIPVWCGVLNSLIFGTSSGIIHSTDEATKSSSRRSNDENIGDFVGPPWMPNSQHSAIQAVISDVILQMPEYLKEYIRTLLSKRLLKPLLPLWVSPVEGMLDIQGAEAACEAMLSSSPSSSQAFVPIVLLSVSEDRSEKEHREEGFSWFYVKGAGDDHENWCRGLSPHEFWSNKEEILSSDDPGCVDEMVDKLVAERRVIKRQIQTTSVSFFPFGESGIFNNEPDPVHDDPKVTSELSWFDAIICVDVKLEGCNEEGDREWANSLGDEAVLHVEIPSPKKKIAGGQGAWQDIFSSCLLFYVKTYNSQREKLSSEGNVSIGQSSPRLLIHSSCAACDDAQSAITIALLLCFFDVCFDKILDASEMRRRNEDIAKVDVQIWSGLVQSIIPKAVLSRSLLKELSNFFIGCQGGLRVVSMFSLVGSSVGSSGCTNGSSGSDGSIRSGGDVPVAVKEVVVE